MRAAFVCRACHRRLKAGRISSPALCLNQASFQNFTSERWYNDFAERPSSSYGVGGRLTQPIPCNEEVPIHQTRPRDPNSNDQSTARDSGLDQVKAGSQIIQALTKKPSHPLGGHRRIRSKPAKPTAKSAPGESAQHYDHHVERQSARQTSRINTGSRQSSTARNKGTRNRSTTSKRSDNARIAREHIAKKEAIGQYFQWGYIRHHYPEAELRAVKKGFNFWKKKTRRLHRSWSKPPRWLEDGKWLYTMRNVGEMRDAWQKLEVSQRRKIWHQVMLSTLFSRPGAASRVLSATLDPLPPGYAIQDVLLIVIKSVRRRSLGIPKRHAKAEALLELLTHIIEDLPPGHIPLGQRMFGLFARELPGDQTAALYASLKRSNARLHPNTALHFARTLAGDVTHVEHKHIAFQIMKDLADNGMDLNMPQAASVITALLHCGAQSQEGADFSVMNALQSFMERGFLPNVITFTALIDTLYQRGEVAEAASITELFVNNGLQLDAKASTTILRGAKRSFKADNIREALELSKRTTAPQIDVLNHALHTIFCFSEMEMREKHESNTNIAGLMPFIPMLRIYAKKFDMEPLQSLIPDSLPLLLIEQPGTEQQQTYIERTILAVVDKFVSGIDGSFLQPDSTTLAIMLRAYVKSLWQPYDLMALYGYFKARLTEQGDNNHATQLVRNKGSLIHDTFIRAMMQQPGLTRVALEIFGDMLKDNLKGSTSTGGESGTNQVHPAPTVFTFGVLLNGLMKRKQANLAEQVRQIMEEHGIEPNITIWNILIKSYAGMQNLPRTVGALQDLEASGFKPDEYTFKAFGRLRNKGKALEMMESIIALNMKKMDDGQPS